MPALAHIIRRRRSRKRRRQKQARRSRFWLLLLLGAPGTLLLTPILAGLGLSLWLYAQAASQLPTPQQTLALHAAARSRFVARDGVTALHGVSEPLESETLWLPLAELPPYLVDALLLADDADFLTAPAPFNALSALSRLWLYIIGAPIEYADTLTSRLTRETLLPAVSGAGLDASLLHIVLEAESRRRYPPRELLEWRLNSRYYGHDAFGLAAAAQVYLQKPAAGLSLAEAVLLAPVAAAPQLNPLDAPRPARERAAELLFALLDAGHITQAQFDAASAETVTARAPAGSTADGRAAFLAYARRQAESILTRLGLSGEQLVARGGLHITTSLDIELQRQAECLTQAHLAGADADDAAACPAASGLLNTGWEGIPAPPDAAALTLLDVATGQILAMLGDATAEQRQPAIVLRPFVYMDALLRRELTPASMVYDLPQAYPGAAQHLIYTPANPDGSYRGPLSLRQALAAGLLPPAAQVAHANSLAPALQLAAALGISGLDEARPELSLLERGGAISVLDAAYAYNVLAAAGWMRGIESAAGSDRGRDPAAILAIETADGRVLWQQAAAAAPSSQTAILEASVTYLMNDMLADGQARREVLAFDEPALRLASGNAAIMDGTSGDRRDSWTVGYTPDLVLALWTGRQDGAPLSLEPYQRLSSTPLWQALLNYAISQREAATASWAAPAGIEEYLVCEISGELPPTTDHCPTRRELVPRGTQLRRDDRWQTLEINRATGQLATVNTPAALRESRAYFLPPEEIMGWWLENDMPLPPSAYSADDSASELKPAQLTQPAEYAYLGARVDIRGSIRQEGATSWRLDYGAEANPERWISIHEAESAPETGEIAATWETALLSGIHTLRLRVDFADGSVISDSRLLTFDNTPPSLRLSAGDDAARAYAPGETIALLADARDNLTIERVEFLRDGELLAVDRDWPYGFEAPALALGETRFQAIAYDQVGNRAASALNVTVERG